MLTFKNPADGEKWVRRVGDLQKIFVENELEARRNQGYNGDGAVFLTKEPTEAKRKPGKMTHRCFTELTKIGEKADASARKRIHKDQPARQVFIDGELAALSCFGSWKWTQVCNYHLTLRRASKEALTALIEESW